MRHKSTLSIRARFYAVLATVSLSLLVLGTWSYLSGIQLNNHTREIFNKANAASVDVAGLRESLGLIRRWEFSAIAVGNSNTSLVAELIELWRAEIQRANAIGVKIRQSTDGNGDIATLIDKQSQLLNDYANKMDPTLTQLQMGVVDGMSALATSAKAEDLFKALAENTSRLIAAQQDSALRAREEMQSQSTTASIQRMALVGVTLLLFIPMMWLTLQSVCKPLDIAVGVARRIATGDLSKSIQIKGSDETAQLLEALDTMQSSLKTVVGEVRASAQSITSASSEVAIGNLDLSERTEKTASNLQSTASSMDKLTDSVQQSAVAANHADELVSSASSVAGVGGKVVSQVVSTMDDINHSSKKIADIISVIDVIAFQTNILALNAAVEAARAGEQGRGFAVVADEVRNLATRSANAAKEISALIGSSVERVQAGTQLVSSAGKTMNDIVESIQNVKSIISNISGTANEQSNDIHAVNHSIGELERATQQNAALVEESAAAAASLKEQADRLLHIVSRFQLDATDDRIHVSPATRQSALIQKPSLRLR